MSEGPIPFNGIRPNGHPLLPPMRDEDLAQRLLAQEPPWPPPRQADRGDRQDPFRLPRPELFEHIGELDRTGWAVVTPTGLHPAVRRALAPLVDWRREQASRVSEGRFREVKLEPGETADELLARFRLPLGPVNPDRFPYYVLLVGSPEQIPFELQFALDCPFAVGRLCFDEVEDYERYATSVVACEKARRPRPPRRATFFGAENPGDDATRLTHRDLLAPLAQRLGESFPEWTLDRVVGAQATRGRLLELLGGPDTPALLFAAAHGMPLDPGDPEQRELQGALLTSEWSGGPVRPEHCVCGADLPASARLSGLVAFLFACYSAGTPRWDSFERQEDGKPKPLAPRPFVSRLAQRLLAHPGGGALAVVGHVDRAWTTSFNWDADGQPEVFDVALSQLLRGWPVGAAMEHFGQAWTHLAQRMEGYRELGKSLSVPQKQRFARLYKAAADARSFVVLGDPAVRLGVR